MADTHAFHTRPCSALVVLVILWQAFSSKIVFLGFDEARMEWWSGLFVLVTLWHYYCLQCFDAVGWWQEGHPACRKQSGGVLLWFCLERGADLHIAQLMPLSITVSCFSKIQIGFTFWYRPTWVVPDKGPLNGCVCVCLHEDSHSWFSWSKTWWVMGTSVGPYADQL